MNSFMKSKKEAENACKCDVLPTPKTTKKVEEESKTSPSFTFKDFQKSINEKKERPKIPTSSFPDELPKEVKLPLPLPMNPNNGVDIKSKTIEAVNEELANEELEEEVEKEKIKEKKIEKFYEAETEDEEEDIDEEDYEDEDEIEDEEEDFDEEDCEDEDIKIVKFTLIPFIFTEKYKQVNGFIKDSSISCYSFLNIINNGIISENEFKPIENQIKDRLAKLLNVEDEDIRIKLNKNNDSRFEYECCVRIHENEFTYLTAREKEDKLINKTNRKYQKYNKYVYEKEYKDDEDFNYFNHLIDYLNIYFKKIYGYSYDKDNIYTVIDERFTWRMVNPFKYMQNIIPFKEIKTKSKDSIITNIMKMGFVFSGFVEEIQKDKD